MKKEEIVIKNALRMTKEADDQLSIYATKNRDCIKVKQTIRNREEFDIRWPFEEDIDRILYCKSYPMGESDCSSDWSWSCFKSRFD